MHIPLIKKKKKLFLFGAGLNSKAMTFFFSSLFKI